MFARMLRFFATALFAYALALFPALSQPRYDPGATDSQIKIGSIMPYTGAFSEYGATGRAEAAYFQMVNDRGGVNGRKIQFISLDSGSDTAKAVTLAHQLVEQDQVLLTVGIWGTPANMAIRPYMNEKEGATALRGGHGIGVRRPVPFPMDDGLPGQQAHRRPGIREVHPAQQAGRQDRDPLRTRSFRP